jgi:cytochrome c-type biogenesis protein CcmH
VPTTLSVPATRSDSGVGPAAVEGVTVSALRRQLEQLTILRQSGVLADAAYDEARQVLERRIVDAIVHAPAPAATDRPARSSRRLFALSAIVGVLAVAGYAWLGASRAPAGEPVAAISAPAGNGHSVAPDQIEAMVTGLAARLKDKPDDADGWAMLGRSYAVLGRHELAVPALKQAVALRSDDAVLLADYADALAAVNGRNLDGEPIRRVERALEIDPNNLKALSLAGTQAFNHRDYHLALKHWEKMVQLAPDSEMVQQVQADIDDARKRSGGAGGPAKGAGKP